MYLVRRYIVSTKEALVKDVIKAKDDALEIVSGGVTRTKKLAGDVSKTVQESVGPALSKTSEELQRAQKVSPSHISSG